MQPDPVASPNAGNLRARAIALYLPQFHPIPENDQWWGKGFTEWTNTAKAKPLFRGHYQPHVPADLGFYDLRLPESREAQAALAREYGVEAFCYYHYWFAGRQILERPFREVLQSGKPDFPFCLCWANQSWTGIWHGAPNRTLIEQTYPGEDDHRRHFDYLLGAFLDRRYLRVDGKPVFVVYRPRDVPDCRRVTDLWRNLAARAGLPGLYLIGERHSPKWDSRKFGFDASVAVRLPPRRSELKGAARGLSPWRRLRDQLDELRGRPTIYRYADVIDDIIPEAAEGVEMHPCVIPNWDNTPRSGSAGMVLHGSTPELFRAQVRRALGAASRRAMERRLVFVKSWNEWAEGNHLEPDLRFGLEYLKVLREELHSAG